MPAEVVGRPGEVQLTGRALKGEADGRKGNGWLNGQIDLAERVGVEGVGVVAAGSCPEGGRSPVESIAIGEKRVKAIGEVRTRADVDRASQSQIATDDERSALVPRMKLIWDEPERLR